MQVILPILEFIQSILTKPAWIMGLFAFVGLVALKRPAHKVMTGTLKPILGYIMLSAGAAVVQENLAPLGTFCLLYTSRLHWGRPGHVSYFAI